MPIANVFKFSGQPASPASWSYKTDFFWFISSPIAFGLDASESSRIFAEFPVYLVNSFHQIMLLLKPFIVEHSLSKFFTRHQTA